MLNPSALLLFLILACGLCSPSFADTPPAKGIDAIRAKADQGNAEAQLKLGIMYYQGEGVSPDHAEAAKWLRKAADQGNAEAQLKLGFLYHEGDGVPTNAMQWQKPVSASCIMKARVCRVTMPKR
jgi:TPR repeat protein